MLDEPDDRNALKYLLILTKNREEKIKQMLDVMPDSEIFKTELDRLKLSVKLLHRLVRHLNDSEHPYALS